MPVSMSRRTAGSNADSHAVAPGPRVAGVVDLVEDDQGTAGHGAAPVHRGRGAHLRVGDDHAVEVGRRCAGRRCGTSGRAGCRPRAAACGPLRLEVLGRRDHGDRLDGAVGEQFGRDAQGERGLAGAGRRDREEVLVAAAQVLHQRPPLPGAQRREGRQVGAGRGQRMRRRAQPSPRTRQRSNVSQPTRSSPNPTVRVPHSECPRVGADREGASA